MSIEWNSIRLDSPAQWIVTKIVYKTLPGRGGGNPGGGGSMSIWGFRGGGV